MSAYLDKNKNKNKGQALTEFIIVMPFFFILLFGIFEMVYMYRAKATLTTATFEAARAGALNNARLGAMRDELISGMMAQYVKGDASATGIITAYALTTAFELSMHTISPVITITSPTEAIFTHFKVERMIQFKGDSKEKLQEILPNDNLNLRSTVKKNITVAGNNQEINIQDANLLKIKSYWCYEMKVPIIKNLIYEIVSISPSAEQQTCNTLTTIASFLNNAKYIAISSQSVVRMQSPVVNDGNNLQ